MVVYRSAAALEAAVKAAAKSSPLDTGRAVSGFYFHRLLCRVFAGGNDSFVLKGGQAMLARTLDARTTRDVDLLALHHDLEATVEQLIGLIEADFGDFIVFGYAGSRPIKTDDEYRSGATLKFVPILGAKRMLAINIDLVVDEVPLEGAERVTPADRLEIAGLPTCDYLVYPVENALADKFCALLETHEGRASSRVKDLVDIAIYVTTCEIDGARLQKRLEREAVFRGLNLPETFKTPQAWTATHERQFVKLCQQTGLAGDFRTISAAASLARNLLDPAINKTSTGQSWNPETLKWY